MSRNNTNTDFFQTGGSLSISSPSYVYRKADVELYDKILSGKFCYVFAPRQMGKTSLKIRMINSLKKKGIKGISLDLSSIRTEKANKQQWLFSIFFSIAKDLQKHEQLRNWWAENLQSETKNLLLSFFENFIAENTNERLVIFIDEIDSILRIDADVFNKNDLFRAIEEFYTHQKGKPSKRLSFVVLGVAIHEDLYSQANSLFHEAGNIRLDYLERDKSDILLQGFPKNFKEADKILSEIFHWTNGQPALTQKLCKSIALLKNPHKDISIEVKIHVDFLFIDKQNNEYDSNLANIENRIVNNVYKQQMLYLLLQIHNKEEVAYCNKNIAMKSLLISGIVILEKNKLIMANKIYETKFDKLWVENLLKNTNNIR